MKEKDKDRYEEMFRIIHSVLRDHMNKFDKIDDKLEDHHRRIVLLLEDSLGIQRQAK